MHRRGISVLTLRGRQNDSLGACQTHTKIAVITGGSSGIGRHTAIRVAQRGAGVILTYNSSPDGAEETVATIEEHGGAAVALPLDVGDSETFDGFAQHRGR